MNLFKKICIFHECQAWIIYFLSHNLSHDILVYCPYTIFDAIANGLVMEKTFAIKVKILGLLEFHICRIENKHSVICLSCVWPDGKHRKIGFRIIKNLKIVNHFTIAVSWNVDWALFSKIVLEKNVNSVILAIGEQTISQIIEFSILSVLAVCLIKIIRFSLSLILKLNNTDEIMAWGSCVVHCNQLKWGVQRKDARDIGNIKHDFFQEWGWFY